MSTPCPVPRDPGSAGTSPGVYQRRRPERTVPYQAVQEHLETWLARQREADTEGDPIPAYVERDLRRYLECGILAYGFARAYCDECGHDFLIAFSCYPQRETMRSPQSLVRYLWGPPKDLLQIVSDRKARQ
jgi:hypothetical protein